MSRLEGQNLRVVLYEGPGSTPLGEEERFAALAALLADGHEVTRPASGGAVAPADDAAILVLGRFEEGQPPAAVQTNGHAAIHFRDISGMDPQGVVAAANQVGQEAGTRKVGQWKPWFPVIDYDRCTNCMQCLSFCLFDVYGVDKKDQIRVQNNDNCKTDCPACSRVCPEVAILFPKYAKGPINGDIVRDEDIKREAMKVDISALLGGDIYASLRKRNADAKERFSTERDESRALLERKKCLKKLGEQFDIPDEVLMSLPSVGDIQERAERAKAKLVKRRERSQTVADQGRTSTEEDWGI